MTTKIVWVPLLPPPTPPLKTPLEVISYGGTWQPQRLVSPPLLEEERSSPQRVMPLEVLSIAEHAWQPKRLTSPPLVEEERSSPKLAPPVPHGIGMGGTWQPSLRKQTFLEEEERSSPKLAPPVPHGITMGGTWVPSHRNPIVPYDDEPIQQPPPLRSIGAVTYLPLSVTGAKQPAKLISPPLPDEEFPPPGPRSAIGTWQQVPTGPPWQPLPRRPAGEREEETLEQKLPRVVVAAFLSHAPPGPEHFLKPIPRLMSPPEVIEIPAMRQVPWTVFAAPIPAGGGWFPKQLVRVPFVEEEPAVNWGRRWMFPLTPVRPSGLTCPPVVFYWSSSINASFNWSSSIKAGFVWNSSFYASFTFGC